MSNQPINLTPPPEGYADWLADLKSRIHSAQQRATLAVNRELVLLYWQIGRDILTRQSVQGWGAKVIERLAQDLRVAFPDMKGFSPRNLKYMRAFAQAWPEAEFVQQAAAQLPWFHLCTLLDKLKTREERDWYLAQTVKHNWSRNILGMQIETRLLERSGKAVTNFEFSLPKPQSDLARQSLKDPYRFDFLGLTDKAQEREVENALVKHVTRILARRTANQPTQHRTNRARTGQRQHIHRRRPAMSQPRNPTHTYTVPSVSIATAHPRQKNPPEQVGMTPPSAPAFTETQSPA